MCWRLYRFGYTYVFTLYDWRVMWQVMDTGQVSTVLAELTAALQNNSYAHNWQLGDFAIIDNLAVGHYAHPDTQATPSSSGLRILHRTTVAGENTPEKA